MMYVAIKTRLIVVALNGLAVVSAVAAEASRPITIVVNAGRFGMVEQAAAAEEQVNWWDGDLADDTACTESFAAVELRHFLAICTGRKESDIRLANANQMPAAGDVFLIGSGRSNLLIESFESMGDKKFTPNVTECFHIRASRQAGRTITIVQGSDRLGALYGVYAYLEKLGVRFFGLGEQDTLFPDDVVELPRELDIVGKPDYLTRGFWAWEDRGDRTFFRWMARNRLNFWCAASEKNLHFFKKLGMQLTAGQHDVQFHCLSPKREYPYNHPRFEGDEAKPADSYAVSADSTGDANGDGKLSYFEAHPEWFGLRDAKRWDREMHNQGGMNYCTSNADATRELTKNMVQNLIDGEWKNADSLNFWMLDGRRKWCQCDICAKQGSFTDRLIIVVHGAMEAIKTAQHEGRLKRNVPIMTLAYGDTLPPPTKPLPAGFDYDNCFVTFFPIRRCYVHTIADPACTEINRSIRNNLEGWTTGTGRYYTGAMLIGEYYNVSSIKSLPVLFTRIMAADIPWYHMVGARHFHYMHTPTQLWGTWRLNQYLMSRLLWDINANVDSILDEYFTRCYPTTCKRMRLFYKELEYATANIKALKHYVNVEGEGYDLCGRLINDKTAMFPLDHLHYEVHHPVLNDGPDVVEIVDAMSRARRQIDDALIECTDAAERARLIEDERRFAYGEAMFRFIYHLVRTARFHQRGDEVQARREFAAVARQAAILESIVDLVQVASSHANAKNGLDASRAVGVYDYYKKLYGASVPVSQD